MIPLMIRLFYNDQLFLFILLMPRLLYSGIYCTDNISLWKRTSELYGKQYIIERLIILGGNLIDRDWSSGRMNPRLWIGRLRMRIRIQGNYPVGNRIRNLKGTFRKTRKHILHDKLISQNIHQNYEFVNSNVCKIWKIRKLMILWVKSSLRFGPNRYWIRSNSNHQQKR